MWIYSQRTGELFRYGPILNPLCKGYSGFSEHKNNPQSQCIRNLGPIPRGKYKIKQPIDITLSNGEKITYAIPLEPAPENVMCGRDGFYIHGYSSIHPGEASEGCIILEYKWRKYIVDSGDYELEVKEQC